MCGCPNLLVADPFWKTLDEGKQSAIAMSPTQRGVGHKGVRNLCVVDILVVLDHSQPIGLKFFGMWTDLEQLLDRPVDFVEEGTLADYARESVERDKILIYERAA